MKNLTKVVIGVGLAVLLSGCAGTQPTFNANNRGVVFIEGKPYLVPFKAAKLKLIQNDKYKKDVYFANQIEKVAKTKKQKENAKLIKTAVQLECKPGQGEWRTAQYHNSLNKILSEKSDSESKTIKYNNAIINGYRTGNAGCSSPMSQQEYQYFLNMQNQMAANARTKAVMQQQRLQNLNQSLQQTSNMLMLQNMNSYNHIVPYNVNVYHHY